jgi:hypothetical protein
LKFGNSVERRDLVVHINRLDLAAGVSRFAKTAIATDEAIE